MQTSYLRSSAGALAALAMVVAYVGGASAQVAGDEVHRRGVIEDDFYASGRVVDVEADVSGDVIVAGRETRIGGEVREDTMVAGRRVTIEGRVGDDLRAAGDTIDIEAEVRDDAALAGRRVRVGRDAAIGGATWIAGREVEIAGALRGPLDVAGETVRISGQVAGDVDVRAERLELSPGAHVEGALRYTGPGEPRIAPDARVAGGVTTFATAGPRAARALRFGFYLLSVGLAGALLLLVFPRFTLGAARGAAASPWKSLAVGFAAFVLTPVAAVVLMSLVVGVWIGLPLLGAYLALLPVALLVGIFFVSTLEARVFRWDLGRRGLALAAFAVALLVLGLVGMVPVAGGLVFALIVLIGLGAVVRETFGRLRGRVTA